MEYTETQKAIAKVQESLANMQAERQKQVEEQAKRDAEEAQFQHYRDCGLTPGQARFAMGLKLPKRTAD